MTTEFQLTIFTPARKLFESNVSQVVLPAFDGECGVLAGHQDFVGLLGTGVLKIVRGGDDYWMMVSSGLFEVRGGKVTVLAEGGELPEEINWERAKLRVGEIEPELVKKSTLTKEHEALLVEYQKEKARLAVHRRTELVN